MGEGRQRGEGDIPRLSDQSLPTSAPTYREAAQDSDGVADSNSAVLHGSRAESRIGRVLVARSVLFVKLDSDGAARRGFGRTGAELFLTYDLHRRTWSSPQLAGSIVRPIAQTGGK